MTPRQPPIPAQAGPIFPAQAGEKAKHHKWICGRAPGSVNERLLLCRRELLTAAHDLLLFGA